jgi:hypothetical protein
VTEERNPYTAPEARVADRRRPPGSPYKAVALGALTDLGGTFLFSMALMLVYGVALTGSGVQPENMEAAIKDAATTDSLFFWVGSIGGCGFSVLGGYVCARIAGQSEYTLGAILAVIVVVLGTLLFGGGDYDMGTSIALNATTVVAVIVGAWIGKRQNRGWRSPPPSTTSPSG